MENEVKKEIHRNQIKFMQWDITKHCNLRCKHCKSTDYYEGDDGEKIKDLTTEEVFRTLDDLAKNGVNRIHFLGGEPFMRKDMLDIVKYASKYGIVCSINTNGTLLTRDIIEKLFDNNVYLLTISLDGASAETNDKIRGDGVFDIVCKNIREIDKVRKEKQRYLRIITSPVITKVNKHEAKQLCYMAQDLGLDSIILTTLRKKGRAKENIADLGLSIAEELDVAEEIAQLIASGFKYNIQLGIGSPLTLEYLNKKYSIDLPILPGGCNSLITKGFIQPDGSLFPCQELTNSYHDNSVKKEISRNLILENGFDNIWNSKNYTQLFEKMFNVNVKEHNYPCNNCKYIYTYCYPCPLPSIKNNGINQHVGCIDTLKRAKIHNIDLFQKSFFQVDFYSIMQKAIDNFDFRYQLLFDLDKALQINQMKMSDEEKIKIVKVIDLIKARIKNKLQQISVMEVEN